MGLDSVELLMGVEETFGVSFSDAEAMNCETPADLIAVVLGKLETTATMGCISLRGFYLLRRAMTGTMGIERRSITLDLDLRSLVPDHSERVVWETLKAASEARAWPSLVRPRWLVVSLWFLTGFVFLGLYRVTDPKFAWAGAAFAGVVGILFTRRFENRIPRQYSRVRDLVPFAVTSAEISWSPADVAWQVKEIVRAQLGVTEEAYRENAHFIHDFGMDR